MSAVLTPAQLREMYEGNRRLTVRTIEAFSEQDLFNYKPAEALRPFADMVKEVLAIELAYVKGSATGEWGYAPLDKSKNAKQELLDACADVASQTSEWWPKITAERLTTVEPDGLFGGPNSNLNRLIYCLENEIHHRGQGFVYLRMLGTEPPAFYER